VDKPYAVRALVVKDEKILMIHHVFNDPAFFGKWTFPGGRLDPHETDPLAALHREMREELSLAVEVLGRLGLFYSRSGLGYVIFAVRPLGPIGPLQPEEIRQVTWLTPAEIYEWHIKEKLQFGFEMQAVSTYLKKFM
jgi:8-oxo-dGTP pyrophosphatase MutT (NUDIX family)